jgi:hypothetical protein
MNSRLVLGVLALVTVMTATAQAPQTAQTPPPATVRESTDPARAEAVRKAAAELRARGPQPSAALVRTQTADGHALLSGGNTLEDRVTMHAERQRYGLWVATVAKPSGAYLADVQLRITRAQGGTTVLERPMEGPWLMVALPPGSYVVTGTFKEPGSESAKTLNSRVSVPQGGQRQVVLRFDSAATVDPDAQRSAYGNPFGDPAAKR